MTRPDLIYASPNLLVFFLCVLLFSGLPEQYYSLTWFLSPILGLILTPLIGSASDRFSLFLNGSLLGLALGDVPSSQPIGIVADASDGPIRAYLLDVADTEEQDMALNIHAFSAGLGGAVGYVLGGLDWTSTILGTAFKSQEQILFVFAAVIFTISVILHMFSIKEESFEARGDTLGDSDSDSLSSSEKLKGGLVGPRSVPQLDVIGEEDAQSERELFINVDRVRSKSDSVLAMPDATIELDSDLDQDGHFLADIEPSIFQDYPQDLYPGTPQRHYSGWGIQDLEGLRPSNTSTTTGARRFPFYRQPSFTFSYYGRVGSARYRHRRNTMGNPAGANLRIKTSQSMNDIYEHMQRRQQRRELQQSSTTLSSGDSERDDGDQGGTTVKLLWLSMLKMPPQLLRLCVCHLLTWFSIIAEAVFYTDFMGQVIYAGDPTAPANSTNLQKYHKGVQMGCWGLVVYAATAAVCSAVLQKYLDNYDLSIKVIYILGTLSFSLGTAVMAIFPNVYVAMVMISTMGIISMSISYCPYALLGQYHENKEYIHHSPGKSRRGFGIDCAILSCQVYIAQILVASALSTVVDAVGSVRVIPMMASGGSFLGFLTSTFLVIYPDSSTPTTTQDQEGYGEEGAPALVAPEPGPSGSSMQEPVVLLKASPYVTVTSLKMLQSQRIQFRTVWESLLL
uniref:Solute carrier family 45 member 4 n=1 Tax=Oncorhynchus kisutch TaxID=8019 RepID=A0A8C7JEZ9_ONCKI